MSVTSDKLRLLAEPFAAGDIEWRVSRAWPKRNGAGVNCVVFAYITARAIANRLDAVCGPDNWQNTPLVATEFKDFTCFQVGISIRVNGEWVTRYDVSEPTGIEAAKGGFSGAMKRAGSQWGIGRYLYNLEEMYVNTAEEMPREGVWRFASQWHKKSNSNLEFYWEEPQLPAWALPKDEQPVTIDELKKLKNDWRAIFAPAEKNAANLLKGFNAFVSTTEGVGTFPVDDPMAWSQHTLGLVHSRIKNTNDPTAPSSTVRF